MSAVLLWFALLPTALVQQIRCAAAIFADQLEEFRALEAARVTWHLQSAVTQLGNLNSNF
jgi:hypothetical protein